MEHTKQCQEATAKAQKAIEEFDQKWPKCCKKCGGAGELEYTYDPSPAGVSLAPGTMTDADPCPDCAEKGVCARCGEPLPEVFWSEGDWPKPCPHCGTLFGWIYIHGVQRENKAWIGEIRPELPECWCWELFGGVERLSYKEKPTLEKRSKDE